MAFPVGWGRKCALTIDHTKMSASQTGFPVLLAYNTTSDNAVNLPQEMLVSGGANASNSDGSDVRFSSDSAGASPLHCEIVVFTQHASTDSSRKAEIWVKCDPSSSIDTVIYVWYKNAGASAPAANDATFGSQGVWDANYKGVWHLPDGATLSVLDSTSNANNGTNNGATATAGKIDGSISVSTANVSAGAGGISTAYTFEHWINSNVNQAGAAIKTAYLGATGSSGAYGFAYDHTNAGFIGAAFHQLSNTTFVAAKATTALTGSTWWRVVGTWDGTNIRLYVNGTLEKTTAAASIIAVSGSSVIGAGTVANAQPFAGKIDEVRLSNIARGGTWIASEYNNQSSPSTFWTVGTPASTSGFVLKPWMNMNGGIPDLTGGING